MIFVESKISTSGDRGANRRASWAKCPEVRWLPRQRCILPVESAQKISLAATGNLHIDGSDRRVCFAFFIEKKKKSIFMKKRIDKKQLL